MKRCPECRRDYVDDSLLYCLEDGVALIQGSVAPPDEPATAVMPSPRLTSEDATRSFRSGDIPSGSIPAIPTVQNARRSMIYLAVAAVAAVALAGGLFGYRYLKSFGLSQIESIAVMPFVNESGNSDVEYLSDGMTDTLISSLSQLASVNVKGRSSVFRYKGTDLDTKTLGKELGVQAVLYGRVSQRGDQLSLSLELLDAVTENVIWSGKYDRKQADVVSLQSEIARDVSNKLKTKLSGADAAKVEKGYTADPEAYKLYLQGRFYWNKRTAADLKKSIDFFAQAIARDPGYALAYSGLGAVYQVMPGYTLDPPPNVVFPKAREASLKALEIDPTLAEPHATLAVTLHEYEWKHSEAESEYIRAIELDPKYPSAHQWYGNFLLDMGRFKEGIAEMERAAERDPFSPIINANLARAYRADHRYDDAIAQYKKTLEITPNFGIGQFHLYRTYLLKGMYNEALELARQGIVNEGMQQADLDKALAGLAKLKDAYRTSGAKGFWQKELELRIEEAKPTGREPDPYQIAIAQLGAGDREQALDSLEKALALGPSITSILWLRAEPVWDPLRGEPRFKELLRKIGLPE